MKYFLDTEFHEYEKKITNNIIRANQYIPTIDLISIGMVSENGREFYAISNEFSVKDAFANKWLRVNVLKPIYHELYQQLSTYQKNYHSDAVKFDVKGIEVLIKEFGLSRYEIAEKIITFIYGETEGVDGLTLLETAKEYDSNFPEKNPEFYAYFADYDWVVFCWLFGRMIDLPKGFPMYCKDLKQMMDGKGLDKDWKREYCPEPENIHNALADARWNLQLYKEMNLHTKLEVI